MSPRLHRAFSGIEVSYDKADVLARLDAAHREIRASLSMDRGSLLTAQQVHGDRIAVIDQPATSDECFSGCDGLITNQPGAFTSVFTSRIVARFFIVDPIRRCIGLVHWAKREPNSELLLTRLCKWGRRLDPYPADLVVQLSPCIRPPHYEIDFAPDIIRQCREAGVMAVHDCNICTACDLNRYYSYRAEKGRTGRMLALLAND